MQDKFAGITANVEIPQAVTVENQTEQDKKAMQDKFANISTSVDIPQAVKVEKPIIDVKQFNGVKDLANGIALPKKITLEETLIKKTTSKVSLPKISQIDISDILEASKADRISLGRI